ncbi:hypothetical protein N658DRAFT_487004 [Parathielavia hyrcaniae]|uniref:Uncharacterized protein n=1 Tax=Parathielavia hyrcaniae TaxID=113614 RepID=A0AAN6PYG1_9PEZI|nr:hypothetical protein N658DRAFT_487004 [Parathielavia hyrcaniae]
MYSAPYGYPNTAAGPIFNGAAPPPQGPHLQPGPAPNQPQQIMFNSQQFPMPGQPGAFSAGPNSALMAGAAGPAGMMQNAGMPHMTSNGQMGFQGAFTTAPYSASMTSSAGPQPKLPANFMMPNQMASYQMNAGLPSQQPMMQRMLPGQQNSSGMSASSPQRQYSQQSQGTPTSSMPAQQQQQQQFSTPQGQGTPQSQTPTAAQPPSASAATPQTPTFPTDPGQMLGNGSLAGSAPQSPATESRDKERMTLLLEINQELLYESIQLVNSRNELKKEQTLVEAGGAKPHDMDYVEEEKLANLDYNLCMRRLQANLTYMFALADRKKGVPPSPAYLTPPPLNLQLKLKLPPSTPEDAVERPDDPVADRLERDQMLKNLYRKLQSLYPGVDPNKEPPAQPPAGGARASVSAGGGGGGKGLNGTESNALGGGGGGQQGSNQNSPAPTPGQSQGTPLMGNAIMSGLQ